MAFDPSWSPEDLASSLCDHLILKGQLRDKPAFIRQDREALIAEIFRGIGLDGERMASFSNVGPLETLVRRGTQGQAWVDQVIVGLKAMLPDDVQAATPTVAMDEDTKEALADAREKTRMRMDRMGKGDGGGGGGFGGKGGRDQECFNCGGVGHLARDCPEPRKGKGRGGYDDRDRDRDMECYNCGGMGHMSRDCPEPRKGKGKGGKDRDRDRGDMECYNCHGFGHMSRDCPEPRRGKGGGGGGGRRRDDDDDY